MSNRFFLLVILMSILVMGCAVSSKNYNPDKKYSKEALQQDYTLLRNIFEKKHPSLYWYTPKDSMNMYFDSLYNQIADSMTEYQFGWQVLAPLTNKIRCGHTSFSMSKNWYRFIRNKRTPGFPLYLKVWKDTMVVMYNINQKDSILKRGTQVTSVNGLGTKEITDRIFSYLPLDGYSDNVNYVRISGNFPFYHRSVFGTYKNYRVGYIDSTGTERKVLVPLYEPSVDTVKRANKDSAVTKVKISRRKIKRDYTERTRFLEIDSLNIATMTLNTFSKGEGKHLRSFFRHSFKKMRKHHVKDLVLDLRSNGGGDITMSALLTKYFINKDFRVADSAYAVISSLRPYTKYLNHGIFNNIGLFFLTSKEKDNNRHFEYWENHEFKPKKRNHFKGNVYILINGPTFSASTIFCNAVKGQPNIKLVGEEAGGGWYGNNGLMIPDVILPNTKLRVRLPLFRIVQYNHVIKDGRGVEPDIYIGPTIEGVRDNADRKMDFVRGMIQQSHP